MILVLSINYSGEQVVSNSDRDICNIIYVDDGQAKCCEVIN